ncbi:MAG TPA: serine hydrolase domain-containing protein, partial [Chthoniobacterales bacterium]
MTKRTGVALWLALSIAIANADPLREQMHAYVRKYADAGLFSGVVLVSKGDRVVYDEAFGFADQTFKVPNRIDTRFHIASLSKPFTAAAALILIEQGKLSLNDKLEKFVPDFPNANKITVEELLTHYSGLA